MGSNDLGSVKTCDADEPGGYIYIYIYIYGFHVPSFMPRHVAEHPAAEWPPGLDSVIFSHCRRNVRAKGESRAEWTQGTCLGDRFCRVFAAETWGTDPPSAVTFAELGLEPFPAASAAWSQSWPVQMSAYASRQQQTSLIVGRTRQHAHVLNESRYVLVYHPWKVENRQSCKKEIC